MEINDKNDINKLNFMLISNNKKNYNNDVNKDVYKSPEYKYYRKRIFQLIKDIMNKQNNDKDIKKSLSFFIKDAIEYIKFNDKCSIIQSEYKELDLERKPTLEISDSYKKSSVCPYKLGVIPEETNKLLYNSENDNSCDIREYLNIPKNKKIDIKFPQQRDLSITHKIN